MIIREIYDCEDWWFADLALEVGLVEGSAALGLRNDEKFEHVTLDVGDLGLLGKRAND